MWFLFGFASGVLFVILWAVISGQRDAYEEWRDEHDI
jgi:hypothetical protein